MPVTGGIEVCPEATIVWPLGLRQMRLCLDLDGCICEYDFPKLVSRFFGIDLVPQEIFAYDLADVLGVSPLEINKMFEEQVYGPPNFIEGALETLKEWQSKGYELVVFSNRVKYMGYDGLATWLKYYDIPFNGIDGGKGKYDIHLDDSPRKLMSTDSKRKLLFDQPWNRRCLNVTGSLQRVKSWQEIRDVCASLDTEFGKSRNV